MTLFSKHTNHWEDMYKSIYYTYKDRVFSYVAKRVKDRNDILDISQNVFVHLWQYRESLGGPDNENIIFKTCNQEISNFFAKKSNEISPDLLPDRPDESAESLHHKLKKEKMLQKVENNIDLLPATRKQILTMSKLEGMTQQHIADRLNISRKSVKKQLEKAMLFLRTNR